MKYNIRGLTEEGEREAQSRGPPPRWPEFSSTAEADLLHPHLGDKLFSCKKWYCIKCLWMYERIKFIRCQMTIIASLTVFCQIQANVPLISTLLPSWASRNETFVQDTGKRFIIQPQESAEKGLSNGFYPTKPLKASQEKYLHYRAMLWRKCIHYRSTPSTWIKDEILNIDCGVFKFII